MTLRLPKKATPEATVSPYVELYADEADGIVKQIDESGTVKSFVGVADLSSYKNGGRNFLQFEVLNEITIPNATDYNIFNGTNGMFSANGTLTVSGDLWDLAEIFDVDYLRPNDYLTTSEPYASVETSIFVRIPTVISGSQTREVTLSVKRRTASSPTVPVPIPNRGVVKVVNNNIDAITAERIPTRSEGASDNYYVYGYAPFLENSTGGTITITAGSVIRVEISNIYLNAINLAP